MYVLATVLVLHGQTAFSFRGVRKNRAWDIQILKLLFMPEGVKMQVAVMCHMDPINTHPKPGGC